MNENVIEWFSGSEMVSVTFPSNSRWAGKIRKFAEKSPTAQVIEDKNGYLFAHIPVSYIHLYPPRELTEEQRQAMAERLSEARGGTNESKSTSIDSP